MLRRSNWRSQGALIPQLATLGLADAKGVLLPRDSDSANMWMATASMMNEQVIVATVCLRARQTRLPQALAMQKQLETIRVALAPVLAPAHWRQNHAPSELHENALRVSPDAH